MGEDGVILIRECEDRSGSHTYMVRLLYELGMAGPQFIGHPRALLRKLGDMWERFSEFPVLFSDDSVGDMSLFVTSYFNRQNVWMEVVRSGDEEVVGVLYLSQVNPFWDALVHITFYDSIIRQRAELIWDALQWAADRYKLPRVSAEIPVYQRALLRSARYLGFKPEGVRRKATKHHDTWWDMEMLGMLLPEELEEVRHGRLSEAGSRSRAHASV